MENFAEILLVIICSITWFWTATLVNASYKQLFETRFTSYNDMMYFYIQQTNVYRTDITCSTSCIQDQDCAAFSFDAQISTCTTFSDYRQCESGDNMTHVFVKSGFLPSLLCECDITYNASFVNVALEKPVNLSTTHHIFYGHLMVDGYMENPDAPYCAHTSDQLNPFALIDLGQSYNIFSIYILNRIRFSERLHSLKILVGNDPDTLNLCIDYPDAIGPTCTLRPPMACAGRYVKFQLFTYGALVLCEVQVYSVV